MEQAPFVVEYQPAEALVKPTEVIEERSRRRRTPSRRPRRGCDPQVRAWADAVDDADLHLSVMILGEIRTGIDRQSDHVAAQADVFSRWLAELRTRFADRVLRVDTRVADRSERLNTTAGRNTVDGLIAGTAYGHDLPVVTRNDKDLQGCEAPVLEPWGVRVAAVLKRRRPLEGAAKTGEHRLDLEVQVRGMQPEIEHSAYFARSATRRRVHWPRLVLVKSTLSALS